jgi:hypothetical protein
MFFYRVIVPASQHAAEPLPRGCPNASQRLREQQTRGLPPHSSFAYGPACHMCMATRAKGWAIPFFVVPKPFGVLQGAKGYEWGTQPAMNTKHWLSLPTLELPLLGPNPAIFPLACWHSLLDMMVRGVVEPAESTRCNVAGLTYDVAGCATR